MAMDVELMCSMCGKRKTFSVDTFRTNGAARTLADIVRDAGWISQQNGSCFDIYCSKKCAA